MIKNLRLKIRLYFITKAKTHETFNRNFEKAALFRDKEKEILRKLRKSNR